MHHDDGCIMRMDRQHDVEARAMGGHCERTTRQSRQTETLRVQRLVAVIVEPGRVPNQMIPAAFPMIARQETRDVCLKAVGTDYEQACRCGSVYDRDLRPVEIAGQRRGCTR